MNASHQTTSKLSSRELQCLQQSIRGRSARHAGKILGLSQRTVEEYLNNAKKKLGAKNKAELIAMYIDSLFI